MSKKFSDLLITNDVCYIEYEKRHEKKFFVSQQFKDYGRFYKSYLSHVLNVLKINLKNR